MTCPGCWKDEPAHRAGLCRRCWQASPDLRAAWRHRECHPEHYAETLAETLAAARDRYPRNEAAR